MIRRFLFLISTVAAALFVGANHPVCAEEPVYFSFLSDRGYYRFDGGFYVKADPQIVWDVLSDFDHYSRYISNMHCRVRQRDGDSLLVDETVGGGFLFIQETIKSRLDVQMEPLKSIVFTDTDQKTFNSYEGEWKILSPSQDGEIKVTYGLKVERGIKTPGFLTTDLFGGSQGDLLSQMQREILKRQAKLEKDRVRDGVKEAHE